MTEIHPFRIAIPDEDLADLRERLARARLPQQLPGTGWERGIPRDHLEELALHWARDFDWRAQEARLNALDQFACEVDGQPLHFVHARSPRPDAQPLLMVHGWPSSPFEFADVIGPLRERFHVVAPSLPGYGFSTPLAASGWGNLFRVAQALVELMDRLGYERFAVHGTDVGSGVAGMLGMLAPDRVSGTHVTGTTAAMPFGPPLDVEALPEGDRERAARFNAYREEGVGYLHLQATRPQTIAYALQDSPIALLAWMAEKFHEWTERGVERDALLTAVSLAWFTGAGASSAHATYEGMQAWKASLARGGHDAEPGGGPPSAIAVFAADTTIRSTIDPQGRIDRWTEYDRGGHFPALETPDLLVADLQEFFAGEVAA